MDTNKPALVKLERELSNSEHNLNTLLEDTPMNLIIRDEVQAAAHKVFEAIAYVKKAQEKA
jgi:hypothetical protein